MRHVKTLAPLIAAAFVCAAFGAATASAKLPEWGQCRETASGSGGKFANAGCTQRVKKVYGSYPGGYEWFPLTRTAGEIESGEQTSLGGGEGTEESASSFKLAGGHEIRCSSTEPWVLPLDGADAVTDAPFFWLDGCQEPVAAAEEPILGAYHQPGECWTAGISGGEIYTRRQYEAGETSPASGTTWVGSTAFLAEKTSPTPSVGIIYKTSPARERFLSQTICEGALHSESLSIQVGGHKRTERIVAEITPVNTMSKAYSAAFRGQSLEALVNTEAYAPMTFEASFGHGTEVYIGYSQRLAWQEQNGGPNFRYNSELELKATP